MYGTITTVAAPIAMYDHMHAELGRRVGPTIEGLLVHIGRATSDGFEVLEIWESQDQCERANREIVLPVMRELAGDQADAVEQQMTTFEVRGLVLPSASVYV